MAKAFGASLKDKPIRFASAELGAKRHICAFFMFETWKKALDGAGEHGFPLTRLGALEDREGVSDLVEYEARLNYLPWDRDRVICTYDISKFRADVIVDIMRTHPMIIVGGILQENPFYVPPDEFVAKLRQRREARKDSS